MRRLWNTETFVKYCKDLHNDFYDYSKTIYINSTTKLIIICKKHGDFLQVPPSHIKGKGCKKCSHEKVNSINSKGLDYFLNKSKEIHYDKYDYSMAVYVNLKTNVKIICKKHGIFLQTPYKHILGRGCSKCAHLISKPEIEVQDFIKSLNLKILTNNRKILYRKELDIYIPSKRIAIEYNGIYWHSFNYVPTSKESRSHQEKHLLCKANGIQLLQVLSNQDQNKFLELVKSKLGIFEERIFARKCIIKDINKQDAYKFLNDYHLQGCKTKTFNHSYGMFYQNELIGVITLCKSRFKLNEIELHRMVFKHGIQVIGGVSKFVHHIKKQIGSFITYADAMIGGECYSKSGGKLLHLTEPNYWYVKMNGEIINRISAQKNKLKKLLGDNFSELLTEQENMLSNNYQIFFDAGNYKFEF